MINRVVLVGRLTKDPELRTTPSGVSVTSFTLAISRQFANAQGEKEADFINVVAWRKQAEVITTYLRRGSLAGVEGRIQTRNYEDKDGKRVYVTEVLLENFHFLESRNNAQNQNQKQSENFYGEPPFDAFAQDSPGASENFSDAGQKIDISEDDLPF